MHFQEWKLYCACGFKDKRLAWDYDLPLPCLDCGAPLNVDTGRPADTVMIATDDLPGGYQVRHGLVAEDGSAMTFYSKSDIKREANRRGLTLDGDTPKPYKVTWDGIRRKRPDEV